MKISQLPCYNARMNAEDIDNTDWAERLFIASPPKSAKFSLSLSRHREEEPMKTEDIDKLEAGRELDTSTWSQMSPQQKARSLNELFHRSLTNRGKQRLAQQAIDDLEAQEDK